MGRYIREAGDPEPPDDAGSSSMSDHDDSNDDTDEMLGSSRLQGVDLEVVPSTGRGRGRRRGNEGFMEEDTALAFASCSDDCGADGY